MESLDNKVKVTYNQFIEELADSLGLHTKYLNELLNFKLSLHDQEFTIFDEIDILNTVLHMETLYAISIDDDEWEKMWYNVPVNDLHEQLQNLQ